MTALASYSTGTVTVSAGGTTATGAGTIWSGVNARPGDILQIGNFQTIISDVVDTDTLTIPPWGGGAQTNVAYTIWQVSPQRFAGAQAMADVSTLVAALNKDGFFVFVGTTETVPDVSIGDDGQYAYQPSTGKRWHKEGGVWVYDGITTAIFSRYDLAIFDTDRPGSGELIVKLYPVGVTFRADLTDSQASAEVAATAEAVYSITKNGTEFATLTFAASSAAGVFACAADTQFVAGDVLRIIAPNPRDDTLSGVAATLVGYR